MKKFGILFIVLLMFVLTACTECEECTECQQCEECQQCDVCEECEQCEACEEPLEIYKHEVIHIINDEFEALSNIEGFFENRQDFIFVLTATIESVESVNGEYMVDLRLDPVSDMTVSVYLNDNTEFDVNEIENGEWITLMCNLDFETSDPDNYLFVNGTIISLIPGPVDPLPGV